MLFFTSRSARALVLAVLALCAPVVYGQTKSAPAKPHLTVYKSPTCGCCGKWVEYMEANGFTATVTNMPDVTPIKMKHGLPPRLASCHTTLIGGYVIEGHVPAEDIRRLLKEKPAVVGLAAPGMPAGSPGMDIPNSPAYDVVSFDKDGRTRVFANHKGK
jgi:hypothetical protein